MKIMQLNNVVIEGDMDGKRTLMGLLNIGEEDLPVAIQSERLEISNSTLKDTSVIGNANDDIYCIVLWKEDTIVDHEYILTTPFTLGKLLELEKYVLNNDKLAKEAGVKTARCCHNISHNQESVGSMLDKGISKVKSIIEGMKNSRRI